MQLGILNRPEVEAQAVAAGFATVEDYLQMLVDKDAERLAIEQGLEDARAGRMRPFEVFDAELRRDFGFAPRA
jgi:hypothetical protein